MKNIKIFFIVALFVSFGWSSSFVYIEKGIKLPLPDEGVVVYSGTPVKIISKDKNRVKVRIAGYIGKKDKKSLYATKNRKLLFATVKKSALIHKIDKDRGELKILLPAKNITNDQDEAWESGSDLFYDKCTKCHHAKIVKNHTMAEWNVLFNSMKYKAKTNKMQSAEILRFLRAFSKDGILRESD